MSDNKDEKDICLKIIVAVIMMIVTIVFVVKFCNKYRDYTNYSQSYLYLGGKYNYVNDVVYPSWTFIKGDTLYVSKVLSDNDKEILYSFVSETDSCYLSYKNKIDYLSYTLANDDKHVVLFIQLIVLMSLIGCNVRSMYDYIGNFCYTGNLDIKKWWPWYLLRPMIAMSLGLLLFIQVSQVLK